NAPNVTGITCRIFDRWGDVLFETKEMPVVWDGIFKGKLIPPGVYVYLLQVDVLEGTEERFKILSGDVTLIR
ncbi:MAG TPA: gliding motility-associated C-terminal domain-containing protein, partial [Saprospiraceae bacterium]|nr:gliding motility-associated C-terminal domain-containing protein [Saprospiraceae bacterium]